MTLLIGAFAFSEWGMRWIIAPWSYSALGPTLTGTWEGPLRARLGAEYRVIVDLSFRHPGRRSRWEEDSLAGRGLICNRHGDVFEVNVRGGADRSGDFVTLHLSHVDPARSALWTDLEGIWDGTTLTFGVARNPFLPDGTFVHARTVSTNDPDDSFGPSKLVKGDRASFLAACGRLSG